MSFQPVSGHILLAVRRFAAAVIDAAIFFLVLWLLAIAVNPLSGGLVRHRSDVFTTRDCIDVNLPPVELPAWLSPTEARLCNTRALGLDIDRTFVIEGKAVATGAPARWTIPANTLGQPTAAIYLNQVHFALLIFTLAALECIDGWTFGKHLLGVRVTDARTSRPLTFYRALERNGLLYGPLAIAELAAMVAAALSPLGASAPEVSWFWIAGVGWVLLIALSLLAERPLPDRWAGVQVQG